VWRQVPKKETRKSGGNRGKRGNMEKTIVVRRGKTSKRGADPRQQEKGVGPAIGLSRSDPHGLKRKKKKRERKKTTHTRKSQNYTTKKKPLPIAPPKK